MLSDKAHANLTSINTWSGSLEIEDEESFYGDRAADFLLNHSNQLGDSPTEFEKRVQATVAFRIDAPTDRLFTSFDSASIAFENLVTGTAMSHSFALHKQNGIVRDDVLITCQPNVVATRAEDLGAVRRAAVIEPRSEADRQTWGVVVDPRRLLGYGNPFYEVLCKMAESVETEGLHEVSGVRMQVREWEREGDGWVEVIWPGESPLGCLIMVLKFRRSAGYQIVELRILEQAGPVHQEMHWSYECHESTYLPLEVRYHVIDPATMRYVFRRVVRFGEQSLNRAIPDDSFSMLQLGVNEGDLLIDSRTKTETLLDADDLMRR